MTPKPLILGIEKPSLLDDHKYLEGEVPALPANPVANMWFISLIKYFRQGRPGFLCPLLLLGAISFTLAGSPDAVVTGWAEPFLQSDYAPGSGDKLHFSGEAGVAFFDTGSEGEFPDNEFRPDEAKLFVEAAIVENIFVFLEIDLLRREESDEKLELGELYIDFENVSKLWHKERILNVRAGRFDIPFGEEYLTRDAIDNPLITHSLMDIWGVDEGIELYGFVKSLEYVVAVQNGGEPIANDFNPDKALVGRILYRVARPIHFSFSAMRTGDLDVQDDQYSELWFGNGFLRLIGSAEITPTFRGDLFEGDGHVDWQSGHVHLTGGQLRYDDDDPEADNARDVYYFQIEAVQNLNRSKENVWHAAARFSRITAEQGFPIVGNGKIERFLFDNTLLTEELWRLSLGLGYRIGRNVFFKVEYNFERGTLLSGTKRSSEDFFGLEAAVRF